MTETRVGSGNASTDAVSIAESAFATAGVAMMALGADRGILGVNAAFSRITGWLPDDVMGRTVGMLRSGHHPEWFYDAMWATVDGAGHWEGEIWSCRRDGSLYPGWLVLSRVDAPDGDVRYISVISDISPLKAAEAHLRSLALCDSLTNLPNRTAFGAILAGAVERARADGAALSVLFFDLDGFKAVNETLGHEAGDAVLAAAAERLVAVLGLGMVARLGGDEFVAIVEGGHATAEAGARLAIQALGSPVLVGADEIVLSTAVGISVFPVDGDSPDELVRNADTAMYAAKKGDTHPCIRFYDPAQTAVAGERLRIGSGLRLALARNEFVLHYQPLVDGRSGRSIGAEALIRWQRPGEGMTQPDRFVPVAEETGAVVSMGNWVLHEACLRAKTWRQLGLAGVVAVNISPRQVASGTLVAEVKEALFRSGLPPEGLELEVTEGVMIGNPEQAMSVLNDIAALGVGIALDDFGTGYSSLSHLRRLPVDRVKIDRSFVAALPNPADEAILRSIVAMAAELGKQVLAEGVETEEQRQSLLDCGIHMMQGYLFGRPQADYTPAG